MNGKGVEEMTCPPGAAGPGDNCVTYNSDSFPDAVGDATYESIVVRAGS